MSVAHEVTEDTPASASPVVLLHGIGTDRDVWSAWLPTLAAANPVMRLAMRGLDGSAPLPKDPSQLLDDLVSDVLAVAPRGRRVHLVGESTGGAVMLTTALRHPERVASVTLCNTPIEGSGAGLVATWPALFERGAKAWSADMMERRFGPGAIDPTAARWFAERQERTDPAAALAIGAMLRGLDLRSELPRLRVPLLVLLPGASPFVTVSSFDGLGPEVEVQLFEGVRHGLVFSHAEACAWLLVDFLKRRGGDPE